MTVRFIRNINQMLFTHYVSDRYSKRIFRQETQLKRMKTTNITQLNNINVMVKIL